MKKSTIITLLLSTYILAYTEDLGSITVEGASRFSQPLLDVTSNISILTSNELEKRGYSTLERALTSVAGMNLTSTGGMGSASKMKFRGMSSRNLLILIDGVRYNNPTINSGSELSHLMVSNIEQIEVIKGAQSGIWGADASAGVINIVTKKATKDGFSGSLFGEMGSYGTQKYGINSNYRDEDFDITLNTTSISTDGFSDRVVDGHSIDEFEDDGYENSSIDFKLGYNLTTEDRVETFYKIIDSTKEYDKKGKDTIKSANDPLSIIDSKEQFYGASYHKKLSWGRVKAYAQESKFERYYPTEKIKRFDGGLKEFGINSLVNYVKDRSFGFVIEKKSL